MRRLLVAFAATMLTGPAIAHHMGPSGVGAGGGMTVFGPATLDEGHGSAWLRFVLTKPDQRSDSQLETLANAGIDAHNTRYDVNAAVGAAYGITHQLTISAELPYVRHDSIRAVGPGDGVERLGSVAGVGDLSILAKYRLTPGETGGIAVLGGVKVPTGSTHQRDRIGERLETEHQPGTGSWDAIFGASAGARVGNANLAVSAIYQLAGMGAQRTCLGDRLSGGIALSHHFGAPEDDERLQGDESADEHPPHSNSLDAFVELAAEWEGGASADRGRS